MKKVIILIICFFIISCSVKNDEKIENNSLIISEEKNFIKDLKKITDEKHYSYNGKLKFKRNFYEENGKKYFIKEILSNGDFNYLENFKNKLNAILYLELNPKEKLDFYKNISKYKINTKIKFIDKNGKILFEKDFSPEELEKEFERKLSLEEQKEIFINNGYHITENDIFIEKNGKIFYKRTRYEIVGKNQLDLPRKNIIKHMEKAKNYESEINVYKNFIKYDIGEHYVYFDENKKPIDIIFSAEEIQKYTGIKVDKNEEIKVKDIYKNF